MITFEIAGVDLSLGERETVQDSKVFKITEFEIQGESELCLRYGEFEIIEFNTVTGFNCMSMWRLHGLNCEPFALDFVVYVNEQDSGILFQPPLSERSTFENNFHVKERVWLS